MVQRFTCTFVWGIVSSINFGCAMKLCGLVIAWYHLPWFYVVLLVVYCGWICGFWSNWWVLPLLVFPWFLRMMKTCYDCITSICPNFLKKSTFTWLQDYWFMFHYCFALCISLQWSGLWPRIWKGLWEGSWTWQRKGQRQDRDRGLCISFVFSGLLIADYNGEVGW